MLTRTQLIWFLIAAVLCGVVYLCWGILTPFILSLAISYILAPAASFLETRLRIKRWIISLILVMLILSVILMIATFILPLIYHQALAFISRAPEYKALLDDKITHATVKYLDKIGPVYMDKIRAASANLLVSSFESIVHFLERIWASGFVIVDFLWFLVLVPFITFHMIKDWRFILLYIVRLIPKNKEKMMRSLISNLNDAIARAVRGQFNVCVILAIYYTVALSLLKLEHSVLLGVTTGVMAFVPFLGIIVGMIASLMVAYLQFASFKIIFYVLGIFAFGSLLDSMLISPYIVGRKIGLHPVWLMFFILLGGKLFGLAGTLLALPLSAITIVLIKTMVGLYYKSTLYKSHGKT